MVHLALLCMHILWPCPAPSPAFDPDFAVAPCPLPLTPLSPQLSESGQVQVRALTRNPEGRVAQSLSSLPNVTVVKGDFTDKASLAAALAGVSRALLVCANNDDSQSDKEIAFIEAATEAGVSG